MDNLFKSRWFIRIVSLAFAITLYVFVQVQIDQYGNDSRLLPNASNNTQTVDNVPVNIQIDEDNYVVSGVPETADVTLEGSVGTLTATVQQQNFDIYVDLEDLEPGTHTVDLEYTGIPEELSVYIEPKTIEVTIEKRASEEFGIAVDYINTEHLPEGTEIGEVQTEPGQVVVTSSQEIIDDIAIVKVFVDMDDVTESIDSREVPVNVYDATGNELNVRVEPESVKVSIDIDNPSKKVPVNVQTKGNLPDGYDIASIEAETDEVEVFADDDVLDDLEEVKTEDINLEDINKSGVVDVDLSLPDGASLAGDDSVDVKIELEQTREFEDVSIDVENLEDAQDLAFIEPEGGEMTVTASGNQEDINELAAEDVTVSVDAQGLEPGEHDLPVTVSGPDEFDMNGEYDEAVVNIAS